MRDELARANTDESEIFTLRAASSAKDEEIKYLREQLHLALKSPRTVTNNHTHNDQRRYLVAADNVNVFGQETLDHISESDFQRIIGEPENAVSEIVRLKHSLDTNANVRCPNKREMRYQVVEEDDGRRVWRYRDRDEVLEKLWHDNGGLLENEADEDTKEGMRFIRHQERVRASMDGDGRLFREQLSKIHSTFLGP